MSVNFGYAQVDESPFRIGFVLSGGGAKGAAHVGFLQALEEAGIVPDYIVGSSVGALVGGYYAAGWRPDEMKDLLVSDEFEMRIKGIAPWEFGFKQGEANPALFQVKLASDGGSLKGNLISSLKMDWSLMKELGPAEGYAQSDFDRLMIPFRCVASDVILKKDSVFSSGNLAQAVRASISFPFYLKPVWIDGKPHFDGGLYNNFPVDVLEEEFQPDFIIGCDVSDSIELAKTDDLASQIETMITRPQKRVESNSHMVVIEPKMEVETFDFDLLDEAVNAGHLATEEMIVEIRNQLLARGWSPKDGTKTISEKRLSFKENLPQFEIGGIAVTGLKTNQKAYAESLILGRVKTERTEAVERNLFLLVSDQHIGDVQPEANFNDSTGFFDVEVDVKEERDLALEAGGNLSSRPVSVGFGSVRYSRFGRIPMTLKFSSSFGPLYSTASLFGRFDFHGTLPWAIQPYYLIHRWNYTQSFSTFFQDVRPSFLVSNEMEYGLRWLIPTGDRSVLEFHQCRMQTRDFTYPNIDFNPADTSDVERFSGWVFGFEWSRNSLDSKQFARRGNKRLLKIKRFNGINDAVFDNSNLFFSRIDSSSVAVSFYRIGADFEHYFVTNKQGLSLGFKGSLRLSDEGVRSTYRSTLIHATPLEPMPGSKSLFLEKFRAFNFLSLGGVFDVSIFGSRLRLRGEYHRMTSYSRIMDTSKGPKLRENKRNRFMAGSWLVCDSQVGLFSLGAEYFQDELEPLLIEFSWGYRLFQNSMRR